MAERVVSRRVLNQIAEQEELNMDDKGWLIGWWRQYAAQFPTQAEETMAFRDLASIFSGKRKHDVGAAR